MAMTGSRDGETKGRAEGGQRREQQQRLQAGFKQSSNSARTVADLRLVPPTHPAWFCVHCSMTYAWSFGSGVTRGQHARTVCSLRRLWAVLSVWVVHTVRRLQICLGTACTSR